MTATGDRKKIRRKDYYNMFESDDFDQILSQFDIPDSDQLFKEVPRQNVNKTSSEDFYTEFRKSPANLLVDYNIISPVKSAPLCQETAISIFPKTNENKPVSFLKTTSLNSKNLFEAKTSISPKHTKRKLIDTHFDCSKRKFPGPAGLLSGQIETGEDDICQIELLSQDVDFTQNYLRLNCFETPIWCRLLADVKKWQISDIDTVKAIKHQALSGNLRRRKAQIVTAFIESIDRSASDPLLLLRDLTGNIKGTLHRDAWSKFSPYIASEYCALILCGPTVLTTGSAFKKHYLNITLNNIYAMYSSAVLNAENSNIEELPVGYVKVLESGFTIIKMEKVLNSNCNSANNIESDLFEGIDDSIFEDDVF